MTRGELKALLEAQTDGEFVDDRILAVCPWIFAMAADYDKWRRLLADELALQPESIRIVGSAATGFSLSPHKPGRPFRRVTGESSQSSDIDLALMDQSLFETA